MNRFENEYTNPPDEFVVPDRREENTVATVTKKRRPVMKSDNGLVLPSVDDRVEPSNNFAAYSKLIYGPKGCGKTTMAAQFPDSLVFMLEFGRLNLPIRQVPRRGEEPLTWETLRAYIDLIVDDDSVQTPVFDTVDVAYDLCFKWVCHELGIKKPSDMGREGFEVWNAIKAEFEIPFKQLILAEKPPLFISHDKLQEVVSRLGGKFDQIVPSCTPACWRYLESTCDFVLYLARRGNQRIMTIRGDEVITASAQVTDHFMDPEGNEITMLDMGIRPKGLYVKLVSGFNNECYSLDHVAKAVEVPRKKVKAKAE